MSPGIIKNIKPTKSNTAVTYPKLLVIEVQKFASLASATESIIAEANFKVIEKENMPAFYIYVSTGSVDNIKPELLLSAMYEKLGLSYNEEAIAIHRIDVYATDEKTGKHISLLEMGEEII